MGAAVSLANLITLLRSHADKAPHFMQVSDHLQKIANVPVRNLGTWAGNVMMTYAHQDFASDVFLLFAASNATLTIGMYIADTAMTNTVTYPQAGSVHSVRTSKHTVWELLTMDMSTSVSNNEGNIKQILCSFLAHFECGISLFDKHNQFQKL